MLDQIRKVFETYSFEPDHQARMGDRLPGLSTRRRPVLLLAGGVAAIGLTVALPALLHRPDVFDSLWGRLSGMRPIWSGELPVSEMALGLGIGQGTNTAFLLQAGNRLGGGGESLLYSLLVQVGVLGAVLFYGALFAWMRCAVER